MKKIKILYYIPELGTGGTERLVYDLCRLLDRSRFVPSVCCFKGGSYLHRLRELDVEVHVPARPTQVTSRALAGKLLNFGSKVRFISEAAHLADADIINSHHFGPLLHMITSASRRRRVWIHTEHIRPDVENAGSRYLPLAWWAYRQPDLVTGVSQEVINYYVDEAGVDPAATKLVFNGVDVKAFGAPRNPRKKRGELGFTDQDFLIGIIANLRPQKNHVNAIKAVSLLSREYPNLKLVLSGDGVCRNDLEELVATLGLRDRVHFLGFRTDAEELMQMLDVYCLPSFYEGMPLSVLEAWSAGRPVVATDVLGTRELVHDGVNGVLVPSDDHLALSKGLKRVIDDARFREFISANGKAFAERESSIETMVEKYQNLYQEAVK